MIWEKVTCRRCLAIRDAGKRAQAGIRKTLAWHATRGWSRYFCTDFNHRCLNMGSDNGRECNLDRPCRDRRLRSAVKRAVREGRPVKFKGLVETIAGKT